MYIGETISKWVFLHVPKLCTQVSVENCEFELTGLAGGGSSGGGGGEEWSSAVRASSSDLTLTGSYVHCLAVGF